MWAFTFKLLHDILPYEERVSNILPNSSPFCRFNCPGPIHADLRHCFFECVASNTVGGWLIGRVRLSDPQTEPTSILTLNFHGDEATVWVTVYTLRLIWEMRTRGKYLGTQELLASLQSDLTILLGTRHGEIAANALRLINT